MKKEILLVEIGTEELPAKLLRKISLSFCNNFVKELKKYHISHKIVEFFSTPRRLALKITDCDVEDKFIEIKKIGPSIKDAYYKNSIPTKAALGWAKNCGINMKQATHLKNKKGEWLFFQTRKKQESIEILLPKITEKALKNILLPKPMRWEINNEKFSRPIRNIVILLGEKIILGKVFNVLSNNYLHNHISLKDTKTRIKNAKEYPLILLQKHGIFANHEARKKIIIKKIQEIGDQISGFIKINDFLIEEVTSLVESPIALLCKFEKKFLNLPEKILVYTIEKKQKCFPVYNVKNNILPYFICISNTNSNDPEKIILGNKKVMHARLSDAEFFFKNDRKIKLENYLSALKKVLFQNNIGSMYEKTIRLKFLVKWIAKNNSINIKDAVRSAILSKCDLVTSIVCEFPELQGTTGMYYALGDKEKKEVAIALQEQYLPNFSGDKIPSSSIGCALAIADKMDTLSGMFYVGNNPSSDKDPFALRRLAIGIIRIIIKKNIPLNLKDLINASIYLYEKNSKNNFVLYDKIIVFFLKRLFHWYKEKGYCTKTIRSVLSYQTTNLININKKIQAISFFQKLEISKSIIQSIKRISSILEQEKTKITGRINSNLMKTTEEIILFDKVKKFEIDTKNLFIEKNYKEILLKTQIFEKPIYDFFSTIKVYHHNMNIRLNRLILLKIVKNIFFKIVDFSYLY